MIHFSIKTKRASVRFYLQLETFGTARFSTGRCVVAFNEYQFTSILNRTFPPRHLADDEITLIIRSNYLSF